MALYENLNLEKGMYNTKGKSLTDVLESLDPSENYIGTELENFDAFSRQLKRFDIRVSGEGSDCVEKFFQTSNSAALSTVRVEVVPTEIILPPALIVSLMIAAFSSSTKYSSKCI